MLITVKDLDSSIKSHLRGLIREEIFKKLRRLPFANETAEIASCISPYLMKRLEDEIKTYYRQLVERDVECKITREDYVDIYLNR